MRKLTIMVMLLALSIPLYANCGNDNGNGNGCSSGEQESEGSQGIQGAQGPAGQNGTNGKNGIDGTNGINGVDGKAGVNGKDAQVNPHFSESNLVFDAAVRLYDGKQVQFQAFNMYAFGRHMGNDVFGDGHNMEYGVRFVYKLGKSYEERRIEELEKRLKLMSH